MKFVKKRAPQPVVHFPAELKTMKYSGPLYGYYHEETCQYNVTGYDGKECVTKKTIIGSMMPSLPETATKDKLVGTYLNDRLVFFVGELPCKSEPYNLTMNIFSRNSGILETNAMLQKSVVISGVGSVGSLVALELARSGVGRFLLIDNDVMAYHNICRHQCGIEDVGKFKVTAVKERLLQINPQAEVVAEDTILENVPKSRFDEFIDEQTLVIGCADNREGDLYANQLSAIYHIPMLSIGFWERAFAGEIFYTVPGDMPCYACMFKRPQNDIPSRPSTNRRFYTHEAALENTRFEPGISTDITFITTIGIKLALDLMNRNDANYMPRLLNSLTQYTLACNTDNPLIGGEEAEIFSYPLQVTRSVKAEYLEGCDVCRLIARTTNSDNLLKN